ncbi:MAG TPA: methyltransferase domain-containing protein [Mycobacterium sp.]|uniref:methyltransferase domain-containing protein n=1 Tax=Mycobacterium sp. TaxID=1785 RepID=UPI002B9A747E|nr:methyltransferase domain-containing protein [Mycobacterium sp.]HME78595.1 methyltransferase domain-containing protein [Mycobacterium sp.]
MSTEPSGTHATSTYVLGHADVEIRRLQLQARLYDNDTEHALRRAGLRPGMRVLDVGCGPGDVSFVAARLVGPTGTVLGVDAAAEIIEVARTRGAELGLSWVDFETATIADIALDEPVDAVVGRLILMHLPDPESALRQLAGLVRPGGVIAFCETDIGAVRSVPETPQFRAVTEGIVSAFRAVGLDPGFGTTLHSLFQRAGLPPPQLTIAAPIGGVNDPDIFAYAMEVWRLMLPVADQLGLVTDDLADIDTLLPRWRDEAAAASAVIMMPPMITAWSHLPGGAAPS